MQLSSDPKIQKIFQLIGETADELQQECYVIGGYVRDLFLERPSKDIDVVTVGNGINLAKAFAKKLGKQILLSTISTKLKT
jgi:tRNA nucleotidyltransferase/poly(A) polymerase